MNYSVRVPDPVGPHVDHNGERFRFEDPMWRKHPHGYSLIFDGKTCGLASRIRSREGWYILADPRAHRNGPVVNDGDPHNDARFNDINTWVGPFVNRFACMEYALWKLGYLDKMGL